MADDPATEKACLRMSFAKEKEKGESGVAGMSVAPTFPEPPKDNGGSTYPANDDISSPGSWWEKRFYVQRRSLRDCGRF